MAFNEFNSDPTKLLLGAVNTMLNTIGEPDLELEDDIDDLVEAISARKILIETKREVLESSWDVNTDEDVALSPDNNGYIPLATNILRVSSTDNNLIKRSHFLYSKSAQSTRFSETQTVTLVIDVAFNELPQSLRQYITFFATKRFRDRTLGADSTQHGFTLEDMRDAYMSARRSEAETTGASMLSPSFDINRG